VGVCGSEDFVTRDFGSNDLHDDVTIGESDDETVFWCIVFIFGLGDETFTGIVISLSDTTALVLGLVATVQS